ncbi:MAG: 1-acyl-sn-glycerol-3-phosphate acyltransferase, partial [Chloroflexota bacterium]
DIPKFILLFSPHTSYVDNYLLAYIQARYGFEAYWLAAEKLFRNPLMRRFLLWAGARPVDRSQSHNLVGHYVAEFAHHEYMILGIAPEGTRKKRDHWKSGFYWMAIQADVPIVPLSMDYSTTTVEIGPTIYPSGDIYADMMTIAAFYDGKVGRRPSRMTPVSVAEDLDISIYQRKAS